ncbi:branched-subunit amino acid ABC-type transport system permease component [Paraburkholderia sp. HC6.4b]|uniref:branched-chain amino acid ABC transporter permease n=1 Tax=unclassified Paraburkholderia TaxID=2615204 RepID=UPI00161AD708|nr:MULTISPECIES: branched-chain amino acid ABC transporter permease [unclassified Paraburkholderia]MBB5406390.1 branched-subunit amino acid ABC-type transport system permease component [Paraburkholderia sp. HC6.4b]MBB5448788.1 branched-subunit amino acid ABC-type transport system permease component [Paraburkholderia sp. Kb1A]
MNWQLLAAQVVAGVANGALYFLVASGLTLLWGALGVVNMAHGSFFMLAAFGAAACIRLWGPEFGLLAALVIVPALVALLAVGLETTLFRRVYGYGLWGQLLLTFGLLLVINNLVRIVFGAQALSMSPPRLLSGSVEFAGIRLATYQLAMLVVTAAVAWYLWRVLNKSRTGRLIRAAVDDPQMLEGVGVDVRRLRTKVMAIAALLAGIAGVIAVPRGAINLQLDVQMIVIAFAVIVIGGLGAVWGSLAAAVLIGVAETVSTLFMKTGGEMVIFAVMVVVLLVRPTGFRTIVGRE